MLELRLVCECCARALPNGDPDARICTLECTFCAGCVDGVFGGVCPNCGGDFVRRPVRPAGWLERHPASTARILGSDPRCAALREPRWPDALRQERPLTIHRQPAC